MQLKQKLYLLVFLFFLPSQGFAMYLGLMVGPKVETYKEKNFLEKTRNSPTSLLFEIGGRVASSWYLTGSFSGELSVDSLSSVGFSVHTVAKYYFIGLPDVVSSVGTSAKMELAYPYSAFAGLGFYHKNLRFKDKQTGDIDENLGGILASFGGTYNLSKQKFLMGQFQYLVSGQNSNKSYNSMELYFGLGFRF